MTRDESNKLLSRRQNFARLTHNSEVYFIAPIYFLVPFFFLLFLARRPGWRDAGFGIEGDMVAGVDTAVFGTVAAAPTAASSFFTLDATSRSFRSSAKRAANMAPSFLAGCFPGPPITDFPLDGLMPRPIPKRLSTKRSGSN